MKIGLVALSSPCNPKVLSEALEALEKDFGHEPLLVGEPAEFYGKYEHNFSANSVPKRLAALDRLLASDLDLIMSVRGGYGAIELLPKLDFSAIAKSGIPLSGFSDFSAVLLGAHAHLAEASRGSSGLLWHGPSLTSLRSDQGKESFRKLKSLLAGSLELASGLKVEAMNSDELTAELVATNLSVLRSLCGTPYLNLKAPYILAIEDTGEKPYRLLQMATQLQYAGYFKQLKGVIFGDFDSCNHDAGLGPSGIEVLKTFFLALKVPVATGAQFGHLAAIDPLPLGASVRLCSDGKLLLASSLSL